MPDVIWTDATLNDIADGNFTQPDTVGIHTGDPGASGTANEASGGSPAYARVSLDFTFAGDEGDLGASQPATAGVAYADATFDLPPGDYSWLSLWVGSSFRGRVALPYTVTLTEQGTQQVSLPLGNV